jgi:septal ring-binding cell division protein DamX
VAAVAAVMVAGMLLRNDDPQPVPPAAAAPAAAEALPLGSALTPELSQVEAIEAVEAVKAPPRDEPVPAAQLDPVLSKLATRAEADCGRLAKARGRWTAQLLVACKPETVDRVLANARGSRDLYVLPAHVNEDACFRVCFGTYATSKEAAAASDLPKALRGKDKIGAVEIAKVLP